MKAVLVPLFTPRPKPIRLAPLAEVYLRMACRDGVASAVRNASVRLAEAALAARALKGRP